MKLVTDLSLAAWRRFPLASYLPASGSPTPGFISDFTRPLFARGGHAVPLSGALAFTRPTSAAYFDTSGTLRTAAADTPRFDHNPATGALRGILIESARTNELLYSGDPGAGWSRGGSGNPTVTGMGGEKRITWTSGAGNVYQFAGRSPVAGETWTLTMHLKVVDLGGSKPADFIMSIRDGDQAEISDVSIELPDNGQWHTITTAHEFSAPAGTGTYCHLRHTGAGSPEIAWGFAQLEQGRGATSYIPTTTAAATRAADHLTVPDMSWFSHAQGTLLIEGEMAIGADGGTAGAFAHLGGTGVIAGVRDGKWQSRNGSNFGNWKNDYTGDLTKMAVRWGGSEIAAAVDGGPVQTSAYDGRWGTLENLVLGGNQAPAVRLRKVLGFSETLDDADLQFLTSWGAP